MNLIWAIFRFVAVVAALLVPGLASAGQLAPKAETRVGAIDVVVETSLKATSLCEAETRSAEAELAVEIASRSPILPRGGALDAIADKGYRGGKLYGQRRLDVLRRYLDRRGVDLVVGEGVLPASKAGGFTVPARGRPTMYFNRAMPTEYEVLHELGHFVDFRRLGREAYRTLPRPVQVPASPKLVQQGTNYVWRGQHVPEQMVFDKMQLPSRWRRLNAAEQQHAIDYVQDPRIGGFR